MQDTVTATFARAVAADPARHFADFHGDRYSYGEVESLSNALAHGLAGQGIGKGDVVASQVENGIDALTVWLATNKLGAIYAPVNSAFKGLYLAGQVNDCGARILIIQEDFAERLDAVAEEFTALERVYVGGRGENRTLGRMVLRPLDELRSADTSALPDVNTPSDIALLVYTSGTTGPSKGCMIPHNQPCAQAYVQVRGRQLTSDDVLWFPGPLFHLHAVGMVVAAMVAQCSVAIVRRFSVSNFWPELERTGASCVNLLGSMASMISDAPDHPSQRNCPRLRSLQAAPFSPKLVARINERFALNVRGATGYGMTEAATIAGLLPGEAGPPGSSGHGGIDFDLAIMDDSGNILPAGEAGEIVCRPRKPNIMFKGYWNKPAATLKVFGDLWFHTGDLGRLDENGYLFFVDRKKDYIRRRGENISSFEMETVFARHDAIQDVAVHAVISPMGEDEVKVTAEIVPGATITEEELCRWSIDRLPFFAVPLYIEFRENLPRNAMGKVLKEQLRAEGKTHMTWDREAAGLTFDRR